MEVKVTFFYRRFFYRRKHHTLKGIIFLNCGFIPLAKGPFRTFTHPHIFTQFHFKVGSVDFSVHISSCTAFFYRGHEPSNIAPSQNQYPSIVDSLLFLKAQWAIHYIYTPPHFYTIPLQSGFGRIFTTYFCF